MSKTILLFDLDGTLTDPAEGITKSVQYALASFGIQITDLSELYPFIGPPLRDSFKEYYHLDEVQIEAAIKKYREYFAVTGLFQNTPYEGIGAFLENQQKAGRTLILATSKPRVFAEQILHHFGLGDYFTFISGCELDGTRESKAEVIAYALKQTNIRDKSQVLMVGDRKFDVEGAKENGLQSLGVLYGYGSLQELEAAGADYLAESIEEMAELMDSL